MKEKTFEGGKYTLYHTLFVILGISRTCKYKLSKEKNYDSQPVIVFFSAILCFAFQCSYGS